MEDRAIGQKDVCLKTDPNWKELVAEAKLWNGCVKVTLCGDKWIAIINNRIAQDDPTLKS